MQGLPTRYVTVRHNYGQSSSIHSMFLEIEPLHICDALPNSDKMPIPVVAQEKVKRNSCQQTVYGEAKAYNDHMYNKTENERAPHHTQDKSVCCTYLYYHW